MLKRTALVLVIGLWSVAATAQVQPENNELMMTLYNQLEALQREVQTLRGMVEEQSNQLRRLQTESRDRYIDVDRRLSELSGAAAGTGAGAAPSMPGVTGTPAGAAVGDLNSTTATLPPATTGGGVSASPPPAMPADPNRPGAAPGNATPSVNAGIGALPSQGAAQGPETQLGDQELYRTALNLLLEQSQYDESIRLFQAYIERFPQGRYLTNAYYWQGEALILVERYEQARDAFMRLITNHPDDPKAAGAMLKLGVVYQRMGNTQLAEQTWRDIATRYPDATTEIREAQSRLIGQ